MNRLAIWRDERLDRHVNQAKHMVSGFYPHINICDFADWRRDLSFVAQLNFFNKSESK